MNKQANEKFSVLRLIRLILSIIVLGAAAYGIYYAYSSTYILYGEPDEADGRVVDLTSSEEFTHAKLCELSSFDAVTRLPHPDALSDETTSKWVKVNTVRKAACAS
ncbi:MAG: hypothetical protein U5N86_08420 [Planctomycetota bacterium]|nr:hypothetical protein [Planctomycetota bacterium]